MRFTPLTDEEAAEQSNNLWPAGMYDFEVRQADETTSQTSGADMIKLEVWIFNTEGGRRLCFDYLVSSPKAAWKIAQFCASCGLSEQYKSGNLMTAEIIGRTGQCEVVVQPARDAFPAKNVIKTYLKSKDAPATRAAPNPRKPVHAGAGSDLDDEIPF